MTDGTEVPADLRVIPLRNVSAAMNVSERTLRTYLANLDIGIVAPSGKKLGITAGDYARLIAGSKRPARDTVAA